MVGIHGCRTNPSYRYTKDSLGFNCCSCPPSLSFLAARNCLQPFLGHNVPNDFAFESSSCHADCVVHDDPNLTSRRSRLGISKAVNLGGPRDSEIGDGSTLVRFTTPS